MAASASCIRLRPWKRKPKAMPSRHSSTVAGRNFDCSSIKMSLSENAMQEPSEIAGSGVDAVAAAIEPEAPPVAIFHLEVVADGACLVIMPPPFAVNPFGSVRTTNEEALSAPGEGDGRMVG